MNVIYISKWCFSKYFLENIYRISTWLDKKSNIKLFPKCYFDICHIFILHHIDIFLLLGYDKKATWRWQWALPVHAVIAKVTCLWNQGAHALLVKFQTNTYNTFWDMNYYPVRYELLYSDSQTDRQKVMHMSPPCKMHRWAQWNSIVWEEAGMPFYGVRWPLVNQSLIFTPLTIFIVRSVSF